MNPVGAMMRLKKASLLQRHYLWKSTSVQQMPNHVMTAPSPYRAPPEPLRSPLGAPVEPHINSSTLSNGDSPLLIPEKECKSYFASNEGMQLLFNDCTSELNPNASEFKYCSDLNPEAQ